MIKLVLQGNENKWPITKEWAEKFKIHRDRMLPLAENGDALAQYRIANIYMLGYLYDSELKAREHYQEDAIILTKWLILSAKQGVIAALDNLLSNGVGAEAEKIQEIARSMWSETEGDTSSFNKIMELAYGKGNFLKS